MARSSYSDEERNRYPEGESRWDAEKRQSDLERAGRAMEGYAERQGQREQSRGSGPFVGRGPKDYTRSEQKIREDICERLTEHGQVDACEIEVEVRESEVILKGYVRSRDEKRMAEDVAESVSGVRDVQNQLHIREGGVWEGREARRESEKVGSAKLSVFGIYRDRPAVEKAVDSLKSAGFRNTDISALFPETAGSKDFAFEKGTKAPEGATTGAGSGMAIGGVLGWLAGIGALAIPGVGPLIAAGPIIAALAGMGVGGAVGGITGALVGFGMPEYEAKRYEGRVKSGHILLSVHADDRDWAKRGEEILDQTGAYDISRAGEKSADYAESDRPMPRTSA